jgi:adenylate cyclase
MGIEIERKFLVNHDAWHALDKPAGVQYKQGYILSDDTRTVRVRVTEHHGYITLKGPSGTNRMSRAEYEYEIPITEADEILKGFTTNGTQKLRYRIPAGDFTWEVDIFQGDNEGLIVAEIELRSEEDEFEKPSWLAEEVTDDDRYANSNLATHPFKDWAKQKPY